MAQCAICKRKIKAKEVRYSAIVRREGRAVKVSGCTNCAEKFDAYLDSTCPACGSEEWYENHSDGFVWYECDDCGHKTVAKSPGKSA